MVLSQDSKVCAVCGEQKPLVEFHRRGDTGKYRYSCKVCTNTRNLAHYHSCSGALEKNRASSRKHYLNKLYGLSLEDYTNLLSIQDNLCVICGLPEDQGRALAVDHCHTTGVVRGLLCLRCNTALGKFRDDVQVLAKAIEYLKVHQQ